MAKYDSIHDAYGAARNLKGSATFRNDIGNKNPYADALNAGAYKNRRDADKLYNAALEFVSANAQYERQLADQERLIDEQREYDSPAALRLRQLAAGINPDLANSSGSSGSSGVASVPSMSSAQLDEFTDPVDDASKVAGGVSDIVSSLAGIVDVTKLVSTFSDSLRISSVAADSAEMEGLSKRIGTFGDIAAMMTPKLDSSGAVQPFTVEDVSSFFSEVGISDPENRLASGVASYSSNPALQKYYSDSILASRKSKADLVTQPFEALRTVADNMFQSSQLKSDCELISSKFNYWYDSYLKTESNATLAAGNDAQALMNDSLSGALDQAKITRDLAVFRDRLSALADMGRSMRERIAKLKELPRTSTVSSALIALESSYNDILLKGSDELGKVFELRRLFEKNYYDSDTFIEESTGRIVPFTEEAASRYFSFSDMVISPSVSSSSSASSVSPLDALLDAIKSILIKRVPGVK